MVIFYNDLYILIEKKEEKPLSCTFLNFITMENVNKVFIILRKINKN